MYTKFNVMYYVEEARLGLKFRPTMLGLILTGRGGPLRDLGTVLKIQYSASTDRKKL